jgi:hypothetical protein
LSEDLAKAAGLKGDVVLQTLVLDRTAAPAAALVFGADLAGSRFLRLE